MKDTGKTYNQSRATRHMQSLKCIGRCCHHWFGKYAHPDCFPGEQGCHSDLSMS